MDLKAMPMIVSRKFKDDTWYFTEGAQTIWTSPVGMAQLLYPDNPHDQLDELNRYQKKQIASRFDGQITKYTL